MCVRFASKRSDEPEKARVLLGFPLQRLSEQAAIRDAMSVSSVDADLPQTENRTGTGVLFGARQKKHAFAVRQKNGVLVVGANFGDVHKVGDRCLPRSSRKGRKHKRPLGQK